MREFGIQNKFSTDGDRQLSLKPILGLWAAVVLAAVVFLILVNDDFNPVQEFYLVPWVFLTGIVIAAPSLYLWYRGRFDLFHPLVFAAWTYFFPAFFIGGLIFACGFSEPYFLAFVQDPDYNLPLTLVIVMLGYGGLTAGFFLPVGRLTGNLIFNYLPALDWKAEKLLVPGMILLILGFINTILGFVFGVLGYQRLEEYGSFDGLLFLTTLFWQIASFLLWVVIFRRNKVDFPAVSIGLVLLISALLKALYSGNRGGLLSIFILILMAYLLSGRAIRLKQGVIAGVCLVAAILIGMIYGTTFRTIKQTEARVGMEQYTEYIFDTVETVGKRDNVKTLEQGFSSLAERLDAVSALAVVVSNYEQLKPFEESYGLDNNIWKDTVTFLIPRVIWADKPLASEPHKYGELYFNYGENSFTITPMGDLLRNYGLIGVPLGMLLLGLILRTIYVALIDNQNYSFWRITLYFMLLTTISYESFYGLIIPYMFKVGLTTVVGIFIVNFIIKKERPGQI